MKEEKSKKDAYERALSAYGDAVREFQKGKLDKAKEMFQSFLEKYNFEKELVDRVQVYLKIIEERSKKDSVSLKTSDDYFFFSVYKLNSGDYEGALKILEKALASGQDEARVYYLMANAYTRQGKNEEALDFLKKAFQKDKFYRILAQNETDFEPLWEDKKFKLLTRMT